ncbi:hypothetical protein ACTXGJ_02360 [Psychrobacter sp. 1Y11]|uniref:hypothetical protein n=1 Tax=Psychrobacter sp. 1Y11 TaxID=3457446 RepID=UPI003FD4F2BD
MKVLKDRKEHVTFAVTKGWHLKVLSTMVFGCMASSMSNSSDLEIYQGATYGNASIMMMLDNSGSMGNGSISDDYSNVSSRDSVYYTDLNQNIYNDEGVNTNQSIDYRVYYAYKNNTRYYDRMSRLKMALIPLFANPKSESAFGDQVDLSKYKIGMGSFFYRSASKGGGKIESPIVDLTLVNRKKILDNIVGLKPETNTPIANAYAEAGAYMLGNRSYAVSLETENFNNLVGYSTREWNRYYGRYEYSLYQCTNNYNYKSNIGSFEYYGCSDYRKIQNNDRVLRLELLGGYNNTYDSNGRTYYFKALTKVTEDNKWDGFDLSADNTKQLPRKLNYQSPVINDSTQCDGYGVYFLTDGEPNNSFDEQVTRDLMDNSLTGGSIDMGSSCNSGLTSINTGFGTVTNNKPAWECIGEYSKALYNDNNAKGVPIATATVGFGSVYKQLAAQGKVPRTITRSNGVSEIIQVYQCDHPNVTSVDAQNLCKLGEKGEGFGEGGFYYTQDSEDIAKSVRKFIEDVSTSEIDPISSGTMSIPLDSLGGLRSRQRAYLPILEPIPGSNNLWNGNLKKYKVSNATLVGADGNFVFEDNEGNFAENTHDLWNTITDTSRPDTLRPDMGLPQVGGTYQKIFENAGTAVGTRNLFVDNGNNLTNLKVVSDKPVNFTSLTGYTNPQKVALLKFMGFSEPSDAVIADTTRLTSTKDPALKNVGGVLHSIPQLITKSIEVDTSGRFNPSTRKDYIIYGSMDGALHMVDDNTGKETFTFVPKQILELQPDALAGQGSAKDGSYPYGVDAPWLTYVSYNSNSTTANNVTTNTYEADQSLALGGLRMGGSTYYALDVTDITAPKMVYSIGSNYANKLQNNAIDIAGTVNGVTNATATAEQKAFAKMGQTWGKPALGYVMSGGKRVMVSFLPGGYDTCYEDAKFKLNTSYPNNTRCSNKADAQGNSVYMVQMGSVQSATNKKDKININDNNGKLLWWASNSGSSANSTSRSSGLQYSKSSELKHSVVTQVRAMDRNYDGLTDHIYFADLGGQVWRADINNTADTSNFKVDRVIRVLDVSDQASGTDAPPRIYERPLVTFYNGEYAYDDVASNIERNYTGVQVMVTVGTGDRSNPVNASRKTPNALYSIIDKDISRSDLFHYETTTAPAMSLRTPLIKVNGNDRNGKLQKLTFTSADLGNSGIETRMKNNDIQGWYMPLTHWAADTPTDAPVDSKTNGVYKLKMFNEPDALDGILISSSYNPDKGQDIKECSAGIIGATQRERTCLPYGACGELTPRVNITSGLGIVDSIVGQYNNTPIFTLIKNRCEGAECIPKVICPDGNCDTNYVDDDGNDFALNTCTGPDCDANSGVNTDKRLNPLQWMEY